MYVSWFELAYLVGVSSTVGVALLLSLVLKQNQVFSQGYFRWLLPVLALSIATNVVLDLLQNAGWVSRYVNEPFQLLVGPVLYFYLQSLNKSPVSSKRKVRHLLLFLLAIVILSGVLVKAWLSVPLRGVDHSLIWLLSVLAYGQIWAYYFLCRKALAQYEIQLMQTCSGIEKLSGSWISNALLALLISHSLLSVVYLLNHGPASISTNQASAIILACLTSYISYSSLRFSLAFASEPAPTEASRYEKSGLDNNTACLISTNLQKLMLQDKPYLDPDLKIASLAQQLEVSVHHLSQVINSDNAAGKGQNFYDFVNGYRIREVLAMFDEPSHDEENILNIAFDSGFTSKATFNRVFKKQTGKTPLAYRQANKALRLGAKTK